MKLSNTSLNNLKGVHPDLVKVVQRVIDLGIIDFSVVEGVRTKERQAALLKEGRTKTLNSKHLVQKDGFGHAVDLYPYPVDMIKVLKGDDREIARFGVVAGLMLASAKELGVKIVWGGDWDSDGQTLDHSFFDSPHFQLEI